MAKRRLSKEFGCGGLAFRWPREIEGLGIGLQGSVGMTLLAEESEAEVFLKYKPCWFRHLTPGAREALAQPQHSKHFTDVNLLFPVTIL